MNVNLDSANKIPGYFDSPWPSECGGPRRQKIPRSKGLNVQNQNHVSQKTKINGEWNVMMVLREHGEVYLMGNNHINSNEKYGFLEKIDPVSLETIKRSPNLNAGGHTWCGGVVVHENGYLYLNNGNRCYKLDYDCNVIKEKILPQNSAYNSLLIMSDGNLVMKNIEHKKNSTSYFIVLEPDNLEQVDTEVLIPENSMGRIAMDTNEKGQYIYVPGRDHFFRYLYQDKKLIIDDTWKPLYRILPYSEQTFSWDSCICDNGCWFLDNGDNEANVTIFGTRPFGQNLPSRGSAFRGLASSPQKLFRIDTKDSKKIEYISPFNLPKGNIFSPPAYDPVNQIALAFDTGNGKLAGIKYTNNGFLKLWEQSIKISMQMVIFPDTNEIVVNDFKKGNDNLVIFDTITGLEKARVVTDSKTANGMFLSTGWDSDIYYCSISSIARMYCSN